MIEPVDANDDELDTAPFKRPVDCECDRDPHAGFCPARLNVQLRELRDATPIVSPDWASAHEFDWDLSDESDLGGEA